MGRTLSLVALLILVASAAHPFGSREETVPLAEHEALERELDTSRERIAALEDELVGARDRVTTLEREVQRREEALAESRAQREAIAVQLERLEEERRAEREATRSARRARLDAAFRTVESRFALPSGVTLAPADRPAIIIARLAGRSIFAHEDANRTLPVVAAVEVVVVNNQPVAELLLQLSQPDPDSVVIVQRIAIEGPDESIVVPFESIERVRDEAGFLQRVTRELTIADRQVVRALLAPGAAVIFSDITGTESVRRPIDAEVRAALEEMLFLHRRLGGAL